MSVNVLRRYTFKLYPSPMQVAALEAQARMMAELWNALLQRREDVYRREKRTLNKRQQYKEITTLRAECPEWAALSVAAARGVAQHLDSAFKAFFRRAKQGAGAQAGYPRYKRTRGGMSISFTECMGSGWSLDRAAAAAKAGGWRLYVKGVAGTIKARGLLPAQPLSWRTGEIIYRDGRWWLSVVVECAARRVAGAERLTIRLDLIDQFARVERASGGSPACSQEQITGQSQQLDRTPGLVTPHLSGDENTVTQCSTPCQGLVTPHLSGDENAVMIAKVDAIKSVRDRRFPRKPFCKPSWRWRRETARAARLTARAARKRKYNLHRWSTAIVQLAADLTVIKPDIKQATASPRGDASQWGAAVETVSRLNCNTLNQAPAMAVSMLTYKAAEANIRCDVITDTAPAIAIGPELVAASKTLRRARRAMRK